MQPTIEILDRIRKNSRDNKEEIFTRLYRYLLRPDLYYEWVWYKSRATGFLNANRAPLKKSENILVFYQKSPVYHPQFTYGEP